MDASSRTNLIIQFAGDSGDGIQLIGGRFADQAILLGMDLFTSPDYPAEIRAPQGSPAGVSAMQVRIANFPVYTAGSMCDVLVAMNAVSLKKYLPQLRENGLLIVDADCFQPRHLTMAGYPAGYQPLEDEHIGQRYQFFPLSITRLTREMLQNAKLTMKQRDRTKNMFALGVLCWMFEVDPQAIVAFLQKKFASSPVIASANEIVFHKGYDYGETLELLPRYQVGSRRHKPGVYRNISGNTALVYGLLAAAHRANLSVFVGSYPITPASDILHLFSRLKSFGVKTFQAEDEICAAMAALGASYGGALGVTSTSGPGMNLKTETISLAVMLELPLVVINVQRAGPSTGMPTKVEQADLAHAMFGRPGEAPLPILAPATPAESFQIGYEACRLALTYMCPVILLSDASIGNGMQSWKVEEWADLPPILRSQYTACEPQDFQPYARDGYGARHWVVPGTPHLMNRIGGLEKSYPSGTVSYDGDNHEKMVRLRAQKIQNIAKDIPLQRLESGQAGADVLLVGWGSTYGALVEVAELLVARGRRVAHAHIRYLSPFPSNLADVLQGNKCIVVAEMNGGQLAQLLRATFVCELHSYTEMKGQPLRIEGLLQFTDALLQNVSSRTP